MSRPLLVRPELREEEERDDDERTLDPLDLLRDGALRTLLPRELLPLERLRTLLPLELGRLYVGRRLGSCFTERPEELSVRLGGEYVRVVRCGGM